MALFNYSIKITGDCSNNSEGSISILPYGGTPPYNVEWTNTDPPSNDPNITDTPSIRTGLPFGTYNVRLNDSSLPTNNEFYVNIPISSGVCASVVYVKGTTCGLDNGSVTGSSTSLYSYTKYYLYSGDGKYITSADTNQSSIVFNSLTAGTYYMNVFDIGGCTGKSQDFIIETSSPLEFGLYIVPNSTCSNVPNGKIYVTGQTGTGPYTYLWSNNETKSYITGLTEGNYSVSVTDYYGCVKSMNATIVKVDPVEVGLITTTPPTCFNSDGQINVSVIKGTPPFYYSASTGSSAISPLRTYTLSNLSSGSYEFSITDAGLCKVNTIVSIQSAQGIAKVTVTGENSTCSDSNGKITVSVIGGVGPYTYTLVYPNGDQISGSSPETTKVFSNLSTGDYGVFVEDSTGCVYTKEVYIITENKYTISVGVTGTTCAQSNGKIKVTTSEGVIFPINYSIIGVANIYNSTSNEVNFTNIPSGPQVVSVTDASGCVQKTNVYVPSSETLNYSLYSTSCSGKNDGTITAFISTGKPPFTFYWSDNVQNNPQTIKVLGLSGGTYSVIIKDSDGCTQKRETTINCSKNYVAYQLYAMGSETFKIQSPTKFGMLQMLNEGYSDLTDGNQGCNLISATYSAKVSMNPAGYVTSQDFYTTTSLNDAPSDNLYYDTVKNLLSTIPGVGLVTINPLTNQITVTTSAGKNDTVGQTIIVDVVIVYDIMCLK